eukprot:CAMPEP_0172659648 /NCGR_PEP_ID=MMETSP1074-20121228/3579_1 /TAXON_ID=2916 /ORGANISM="Ceratium fusus, Strain PA161109" /LENGTH=139 /DNA_ID=CAMNT_0013475167 /DNA_START=610 /DNA_END=1029 /DNA_ORIENTATION=+
MGSNTGNADGTAVVASVRIGAVGTAVSAAVDAVSAAAAAVASAAIDGTEVSLSQEVLQATSESGTALPLCIMSVFRGNVTRGTSATTGGIVFECMLHSCLAKGSGYPNRHIAFASGVTGMSASTMRLSQVELTISAIQT